jgi:hypothetical protein
VTVLGLKLDSREILGYRGRKLEAFHSAGMTVNTKKFKTRYLSRSVQHIDRFCHDGLPAARDENSKERRAP